MKNLASIILFSALFMMVGCNDDNSILEPTTDLSIEQLPKGRPIIPPVDDYKLFDGDLFSKDSLSSAEYEDLGNIELNY